MNARKMNENVKATAIYFTYDHINHKIDGTEENFRLSGIPGSAQDLALMDCLREHPDYSFRIVKPKKEKNSYKGLGRELMHDYIDCFGSEDMMEKFQQMKKDGTAFATMKSWFLELFPKPAFRTVLPVERFGKRTSAFFRCGPSDGFLFFWTLTVTKTVRRNEKPISWEFWPP